MKRALLVLALLLGSPLALYAQDKPPEKPLAVEWTQQERQVLDAMCQAAVWAARAQFDGMCDRLKAKFAEAEAKAKVPDKKEPPK